MIVHKSELIFCPKLINRRDNSSWDELSRACEDSRCAAWKQLSKNHGFCGLTGEPTSYELQQFMGNEYDIASLDKAKKIVEENNEKG